MTLRDPAHPARSSSVARRLPLSAAAALLAVVHLALTAPAAADPQGDANPTRSPNIVLIYADDIGYGDIGAYGAELIPTPHIDQLAAGGALFTSGYCTSSTCTPSRYSLLTGQYAFRNQRARILAGDAPLLIEPGSHTLPELLRGADYRTAVIGKWHLGMGDGNTDWNTEIKPGPLEVGFDESFVIPATNDRVPTVWVDGHRVHNWSADDDPIRVSYREPVGDLPTGISHPDLLRYGADRQHSGTIVKGISRIGWMDGGQSAWWDDEDMVHEITGRSLDFIRHHRDSPFFLFMSMHENHVPRAPHPDFVGKSGTGLRGDAVVELDWAVGQIMELLDELELAADTLVIFTSDNGPIFFDGYHDGSVRDANDHPASGPFRGGKYHVYEGGTRVPTITRWPGRIQPGTVSDAILSQVDLPASLAALAGVDLPDGAALDSLDQLAAWLGEDAVGRDHVVQQGTGTAMAIRQNQWKLIPATENRGFGTRHNQSQNPLTTPMPPANQPLLFDLDNDPGETTNLAEQHPDIVDALTERLDQLLKEPDPRGND